SNVQALGRSGSPTSSATPESTSCRATGSRLPCCRCAIATSIVHLDPGSPGWPPGDGTAGYQRSGSLSAGLVHRAASSVTRIQSAGSDFVIALAAKDWFSQPAD